MTAQEHVQAAEELLEQAAKKGTPAPVVAGHASRATAHATLALVALVSPPTVTIQTPGQP